MRAFVAVLVFATVAAGCTGSGVAPSQSNDDGPHVSATATTGVIKGVVVDAAVHPLKDARVTVLVPNGLPLRSNSSATGAFAFAGLAPGSYFVQAEKVGYAASQTSVEVRAGDDHPQQTKLQLIPDPANSPYFDTYVFKGYIECSTSVLAACSGPNIGMEIANLVTCEVANDTATPTCTTFGNVTDDNFSQPEIITKLPDQVQSELTWEATSSAGQFMTLYHSYTGKDHIGSRGDIASTTGQNPLVLASLAKDYKKVGLGNDTDLLIRVFASGDPNVALGAGGAVVEQSFTVYTHVFYGYRPPAGWTFSKDGDPPPAQ